MASYLEKLKARKRGSSPTAFTAKSPLGSKGSALVGAFPGIKKMNHCLNGSWCSELMVVDHRQVCRRNGQPIFDLDACPLGYWFSVKPHIEKD